ncbi:DVUA0089 family protein [Paludisphaera mucosa]|uniref:DVUA0089 family protein n=1 Tax=Paludisphaera mucosa TaxID=3030827 RepID=A0ABT6FDA0_9BACT|nr:DVUA0089 family protein [Paludisphaera mucosa]MDG3005335.1 DVUA0089 family protein [Paludisphaera mucosa]
MSFRRVFTFGILAFATSMASSALAGSWVEIGDAGSLPSTAQYVLGSGPLDLISGQLADEFDVDVYAIYVDGGGTFSASTVGLTSVDTKLFLFDASGLGVYGNDDADVFTLQSLLPAGDPLTPLAAGVYFLAVTSYPIDPLSAGGSIFLQPLFPEEVVGPVGPGGSSPVTGYDGSGEAGAYGISLTGARFINNTAVPEPSTLTMTAGAAALGLGVGAAKSRRGRRAESGRA